MVDGTAQAQALEDAREAQAELVYIREINVEWLTRSSLFL